MSRADDSAVQDLDFASLRSQLGPLALVSALVVNSLFPLILRHFLCDFKLMFTYLMPDSPLY